MYALIVCDKAFSSNTTQRIADEHDFFGQIPCDVASQSEIIIPIKHNEKPLLC